MSAAASVRRLESPSLEEADPFKNLPKDQQKHEQETLKSLAAVSPPVIAIDLDDTLSETNKIISEWHNERFGSTMDISTFYYYYYWKNPFWGTIKETFEKTKDFYATDTVFKATPVPGALDGITALRDMGYHLIIVTARTQDHQDESWEWVNRHFPGLFHRMICTGQFKDAHKEGHEVGTRLSKAQVCHELGAKLLIDDSTENAMQCVTAEPPIPVLLFGEYEWNKRISLPEDATDEMSFGRRLAANEGREFWKEETVVFPDGAPLHRTKDWAEIVEWMTSARAEGKL